MEGTLYRRPLPDDTTAFSSPEGRRIFGEALADGGLEGWFPLAEQFHTQADPAFCGLGSLVVALNALGIDPGRLWKGPWRWFGEELLDCCVPLEQVRERGVSLDELACLARCNGAEVGLRRAEPGAEERWREALATSARGDAVILVAYDRSAVGQTGGGHFSPVGGWHRGRDLALVLDVARFKYPPHWMPVDRLWRAMLPHDPATGRPRGWLEVRARPRGTALGFTVSCDESSWRGLGARMAAITGDVAQATDVEGLARAVVPLAPHVERRTPELEAHREALAQARTALQRLPLFDRVTAAVGPEDAEVVTMLLLSVLDLMAADRQVELARLIGPASAEATLAAELVGLRSQLAALWRHARGEE